VTVQPAGPGARHGGLGDDPGGRLTFALAVEQRCRTGLALLLILGCGVAALASELRRDERVVFYPVAAWRVTHGWEADLHGCAFEPESRKLVLPLLSRALGLEEGELSRAERDIYRERMRLFLVDHKGDRTVAIHLAGQRLQLGSSADNGHSVQRIRISDAWLAPSDLADQRLHFQAILPEGLPTSAGQVHLLAKEGLSVVSDIDDTIKISQVRNRGELLRNTFCRPFQPVPGMAELYQAWAQTNGACFHYVSASPWQLYPPLAQFVVSNGFPAGTFHLRHFRLTDETFLELFKSSEAFKMQTIESLLARFPQRRFLLVGDSGERDPEIYAALARRHPAQIQRVLIRDVTGEAPTAPRYEKAFAGLPAGLWQILDSPPAGPRQP
jgi:hypothetical protein